ncbi:hypothetical protein OKJ48_12765 [Streptomyces kunmingensis]|uniref:Small hydrophilic protein n=1 Tax=Streptomyces kunmingensis TaxID=68225 RepID=A0ABU6CAB4_9ACTN|nr:hypothetical protein [Streptomyces kunmingensis]MEB3961112.1 hypothetical protein [Streptomyces kunmingensis]
MAKNKNRKQGGQQNRASQAELSQEQSKSALPESQPQAQATMEPQIMGNPSDVARKHQKRFGHN